MLGRLADQADGRRRRGVAATARSTSTTFTEEELRAAVEAAENWGTYVTVHAYTPAAIQRAIAAGVKCIEHGHLMDEATAQLMAEKGIWLSIQPFPDELADAFPPGSVRASQGARGVRRHGRGLSSWPRSTSSRRPGAPISCSPAELAQRQRRACWRSWRAGTRRPKC